MPSYLEFEVSLREIEPAIWRRFLLRKGATFHQLHLSIQLAGPWRNHHLYEFCHSQDERRVIAGIPDGELEKPVSDARRLRLDRYFVTPGTRCLYRYDFGDDWEHDVELIQVVDMPDVFLRRLLDGKRTFPPEDSGGVPGYYECLAAIGEEFPIGEGFTLPSPDELADRRIWLGSWRSELDLAAARRTFDR